MTLIDLLRKPNILATQLKPPEKDLFVHKDAFSKMQLALQEERASVSSLKEKLDVATKDLHELTTNLLLQMNDLNQEMAKYGLTMTLESIDSALSSLETRCVRWKEANKKKEAIVRDRTHHISTVEGKNALLSQMNTSLEEVQSRINAYRSDIAIVEKERNLLYGKKDPDSEEKRVTESLELAREKQKMCTESSEESQKTVATLKTLIDSLDVSIKECGESLSKLEEDFFQSITSASFLSEEDFLSKQLPVADRDSLEEKAQSLKEEKPYY